jgi:hypothetical protein
MGTPDAIATVSYAIAGILRSSSLAVSFPGALVEVYQPRTFREPMAGGLSLYLYAVGLNSSVRNAPDPRGRPARRPPISLELHYLLTPWSPSPTIQQQLLGHALALLEATPVISGAVLNSHAPGGLSPFRPDETVSITHEQLSLDLLLKVSEVDGVTLPASMSYLVRTAIDPTPP